MTTLSCHSKSLHCFLVLFPLFIFLCCLSIFTAIVDYLNSNCPILTVFKQCPALWGTETKTKVLSFCDVVPLSITDELNFFSDCNLVTSSSLSCALLVHFFSGLQWSVVLLEKFFFFNFGTKVLAVFWVISPAFQLIPIAEMLEILLSEIAGIFNIIFWVIFHSFCRLISLLYPYMSCPTKKI